MIRRIWCDKKVQITIDFSATYVKESIIYVQWESNGMSFRFYDM